MRAYPRWLQRPPLQAAQEGSMVSFPLGGGVYLECEACGRRSQACHRPFRQSVCDTLYSHRIQAGNTPRARRRAWSVAELSLRSKA